MSGPMSPLLGADPIVPPEHNPVAKDFGATPESLSLPPTYGYEGDAYGYGYGYGEMHGYGGDAYEYGGTYEYPLHAPAEMDPGLPTQSQDPYPYSFDV